MSFYLLTKEILIHNRNFFLLIRIFCAQKTHPNFRKFAMLAPRSTKNLPIWPTSRVRGNYAVSWLVLLLVTLALALALALALSLALDLAVALALALQAETSKKPTAVDTAPRHRVRKTLSAD